MPLGALQVPLVALPPTVPVKFTLPPEQMLVEFAVAEAVGLGDTVIVLSALAAVQPLPGSALVNRKVTVPLKFAAGV